MDKKWGQWFFFLPLLALKMAFLATMGPFWPLLVILVNFWPKPIILGVTSLCAHNIGQKVGSEVFFTFICPKNGILGYFWP